MPSPVSTAQTESAPLAPLPPTRHRALLLEQASTSFLRVERHSRKEEKNGCDEIKQMEVRLWFLDEVPPPFPDSFLCLGPLSGESRSESVLPDLLDECSRLFVLGVPNLLSLFI